MEWRKERGRIWERGEREARKKGAQEKGKEERREVGKKLGSGNQGDRERGRKGERHTHTHVHTHTHTHTHTLTGIWAPMEVEKNVYQRLTDQVSSRRWDPRRCCECRFNCSERLESGNISLRSWKVCQWLSNCWVTPWCEGMTTVSTLETELKWGPWRGLRKTWQQDCMCVGEVKERFALSLFLLGFKRIPNKN